MTKPDPLCQLASAFMHHYDDGYGCSLWNVTDNIRRAHVLTMLYIYDPPMSRAQAAVSLSMTRQGVANIHNRGLLMLAHPQNWKPLQDAGFFERHTRLRDALCARFGLILP